MRKYGIWNFQWLRFRNNSIYQSCNNVNVIQCKKALAICTNRTKRFQPFLEGTERQDRQGRNVRKRAEGLQLKAPLSKVYVRMLFLAYCQFHISFSKITNTKNQNIYHPCFHSKIICQFICRKA